MIAAIALGVALVSSDVGLSRPQLLEAKAACRLLRKGKMSSGVAYSVSGAYARGTHWTSFEIPACDEPVMAIVIFHSGAAAKISAWHTRYKEKCGADLIGDRFSGMFTGVFSRRKVRAPLVNLPPVMTNIFEISDFESEDLNAFPCPE